MTAVEDATYTPAGNVTVELEATSTAMASTGNFTPVGTVSAPTVTVTPDTTQIQHINSVGTLPTYTGAVYTAPSVTEQTSKFATAGMIAAMDGEDAELLVLSVASTADAITSTGFNAGSYTAAEFNAGSLPTLGDAQTVVTGIASAVATAPTFTGTEGAVSVSGNYDKASVKTATFAGTEATISHNVTTEAKTVTVQ